jgi:two-component system sensor histidine kinase HydH
MAGGRVPRIPRLAVCASLVIIALCFAGTVYLYQEQMAELGILRAKRANYDTVRRIETRLSALIVALQTGTDQEIVAANQGLHASLVKARELADTEEEIALSNQLLATFDRYRQSWQRGRTTAHGSGKVAVDDLVSSLRRELRPTCFALQDVDFKQAAASEQNLAQSMRTMAWGLGGAGLLGSLASLVLGYNAARSLRHSLQHLSINIQTATGKLGLTVPAVTIGENHDFERMHQQMHELTEEIEKVVAKLQQHEREVLRAEQLAAVGQIAAGVAHELRNPLTSIKLLIHAQRQEVQALGQSVEDCEIVEQEIRRMDQCLQAFLDFARPPRAVRRPNDLVPLVGRALALVEGRARKQKVAVHFRHDDGPLVVDADGEQVVQVLVNLTLNALDVMPRGGRLDVELHALASTQVKLRVLDNGPGVSPNVLPRLFEPFASGKETGLGLGLAISRQIVEGHGGSLRGGNRLEGGACFEVYLPVSGEARAEGPRVVDRPSAPG